MTAYSGRKVRKRSWANIAVGNAHALIIEILQLNNTRFERRLDERIRSLEDGWRKSWLKTPQTQLG
jgi:hypothetical protein